VLSGSDEIGDAEGVATVADDDAPPVVGVSDAPVAAEGASAVFTISLSQPSGRDISVGVTTADADALAGQDYTQRSGTLAIPAGATTATSTFPWATTATRTRRALRAAHRVRRRLRRSAVRPPARRSDNDVPPPPVPAPPSPGDAQSAPTPDASGSAADADGAATARPVDFAPGASSLVSQLGLSSPRLRRPSSVLVTVSCPREAVRCSGRVGIFSRANPRSRIKALRQERRSACGTSRCRRASRAR